MLPDRPFDHTEARHTALRIVAAVNRRRRRRRAVLTLAGSALLVLFLFLIGTAGDRSDRLRANGGRTTGTVVNVAGSTGLGSGSASVEYSVTAAGARPRRFVERVDLGDETSGVRVGDQVTVFYDRTDPNVMTIDDIDNQSALSVQLSVWSLVLGVFMVVGGVVGLLGTRRLRRAAQSAQWSITTAVVRTTGSVRARRVRLELADGERATFRSTVRGLEVVGVAGASVDTPATISFLLGRIDGDRRFVVAAQSRPDPLSDRPLASAAATARTAPAAN